MPRLLALLTSVVVLASGCNLFLEVEGTSNERFNADAETLDPGDMTEVIDLKDEVVDLEDMEVGEADLDAGTEIPDDWWDPRWTKRVKIQVEAIEPIEDVRFIRRGRSLHRPG